MARMPNKNDVLDILNHMVRPRNTHGPTRVMKNNFLININSATFVGDWRGPDKRDLTTP